MRPELVLGDITEQRVDAIVNAANSSLMGGGGVDGAIHRRGGPAIVEECRELRRSTYPDGLPAGRATATTAGKLDDRSAILRSCYSESLRVAAELGAQSVAFPLVSSGIYGWPIDDALRQAIGVLRAASLDVRLVLFQESTLRTAQQTMQGWPDA
jgi:O-acetyl-ADP-ribose deacetylase (regulator of RNase III)